MRIRYIYTGIIAAVILIIAFSASTVMQEQTDIKENKNLIKFSHKKHLEMVTDDCTDCHSAVPESSLITDELLPVMDNCADCHETEDDEECSTCHYEDVYEPLVPKVSPVIFNHKFHISEQKLECRTCHQGLEKVDYGFESETIFPAMNICADCHSAEKTATIACEACHISTVDLYPQSHKVADFETSHKFLAQDSDANCNVCHETESFCEDCHVVTVRIDETNKSGDFYIPYSPHNFKDGVAQQVITRRHELNYRYTHGIDAIGKTSECQTCHQKETFCTECHTSENEDFLIEGNMPKTHLAPNFTTLGVGSGGGEHAVLAQRDIETCAACHDVEMGDPVCITCHVDNDGIRGTNPKTHPDGFMSTVNGDWHNDDGSVCFACHVTASATTGTAGINFCGYCHDNNPG